MVHRRGPAHHSVSVALQAGRVALGDPVLVTDIEAELAGVALSEMAKLTNRWSS
jgi:hypothetical protein